MSEIRRWGFCDNREDVARFGREHEGKYVLYADHLKELEGLRELNETKRIACEDLAKFADEERNGRLKAEAQLRSKDEQLAGMRDALELARELILSDYTRASMADGYWPTVKPQVDIIDAALSGPSPAREGTE